MREPKTMCPHPESDIGMMDYRIQPMNGGTFEGTGAIVSNVGGERQIVLPRRDLVFYDGLEGTTARPQHGRYRQAPDRHF